MLNRVSLPPPTIPARTFSAPVITSRLPQLRADPIENLLTSRLGYCPVVLCLAARSPKLMTSADQYGFRKAFRFNLMRLRKTSPLHVSLG